MFELGEKVVVIKGPMKGNEGSIKAIFKGRGAYGVRFSNYDNPCTKSGCYYFKKEELDTCSAYPNILNTLYKRPIYCCCDTVDSLQWLKNNPALNNLFNENIQIKNVLFNEPATIVFWTDNTKTVVKCQGDERYDPEKGLAMAISKKFLGNKRDYYHTFLKWLKKYDKEYTISNNDVVELMTAILDDFQKEGKTK